MRYHFGRFELQPQERRLAKDGVVVPLTRRAFDILLTLVERPGELVTKDELMARVWPSLVVEESNLPVQVSALRRILGSEAIETVTGSGYRFRLAVRGEDSPAAAPAVSKHNLPRALTSYIAPDGQVEALSRLLDDTRLLTLTGAAGLGKTRASQQIAHACLDRYEDGVWLVELAPVADAELVPQAVAAALGVQNTASGDLSEIVKQYVKDRRMLLLLDNCEHLLQGCARFARLLLETAPHLKVLATSREVLHLPGETTLFMQPLRTPEEGKTPAVAELVQFDSVRLFVDRATAANPGFVLSDANASDVASICTQLDGIPLAIELAAVQVRALPVNAIAARLGDRFRLLKAADRTAPARHRTLEATLAWSYDLLLPAEQRLLARLSVFAGGCTIEAAESIGSGDDIAPASVFDLLARLVEKSLVVFEPDADRYRLLETIRHYAFGHLGAAGDADATRSRHASYFLGVAEAAEAKLFGPSEEACNLELDRERNNIRAAYRRLLESGEPERVLDIFFNLRRWFCASPFDIIRPDLFEAIDRVPADGFRRCRAFFTAAFCEYYGGRYPEARAHAQESCRIALEIGDVARAADALTFAGSASHALCDLPAAEQQLGEAVALARESGDRQVLLDALNSVAELYSVLERFDLATEAYTEGLEVARREASLYFRAFLCINLGRVALSRSDPVRSKALLQEAMMTFDEAGSTRKIHALLLVCAGLAAARQEWTRAARISGSTHKLFEDIGQRIEPADENALAPLRAQARRALGDQAYDAAFAEGGTANMDAVVTEVRAWLYSPDATP